MKSGAMVLCSFTSAAKLWRKRSGRPGQGGIKLLDFSLSSIGWRRGLGRGGAFLLVSPLLGPLPARSSRGEDGELDAALENLRRENFVLAKISRDDAGSPSSLKVQGCFAIPQLQLNVREPREK